ncbi:hypothetical protein [Streptomyces chiangmaiensis]|uniref:Secreted protein n=1 Tax=Streptomyces chiangmaiensis TaxID=766497 RepID=A0ABU7FCC6_9ACTN|nr:hypothetical protein [Streptomyces chiangmaiensis]MED7821817.1 hypothetical protein [Streptomyces chiangmaiensis]
MTVAVVGAAGVLTVAIPAKAKAATALYPHAPSCVQPAIHGMGPADGAWIRTNADNTPRTAPAAA